jgi:hypothetical protein
MKMDRDFLITLYYNCDKFQTYPQAQKFRNVCDFWTLHFAAYCVVNLPMGFHNLSENVFRNSRSEKMFGPCQLYDR